MGRRQRALPLAFLLVPSSATLVARVARMSALSGPTMGVAVPKCLRALYAAMNFSRTNFSIHPRSRLKTRRR